MRKKELILCVLLCNGAAFAQALPDLPPPPSLPRKEARSPIPVPVVPKEPKGPAQDLMVIYDLARKRDAEIAQAENDLAAGQEAYPQARAALLPYINTDGDVGYNNAQVRTWGVNRNLYPGMTAGAAGAPGGAVSQDNKQHERWRTWDYGFNLTQPVYNAQLFARFRQSKDVVRQAEQTFKTAEQDLIMRVAQRYFDVLYAQDSLAFTLALKAARQEQLERAKRSFEVGTATIVEVDEAQAGYDAAVAQEIQAHNAIAVARENLAQMIGEMTPPLKHLETQSRLPLKTPQPQDLDYWVAEAEKGNLMFKSAQEGLKIAQEEWAYARGERHPRFTFVSRYGEDNSTGSLGVTGGAGSDSITRTYFLQMELPIFAGGGISSRIREAASRRESSKDYLEYARRSAVFTAQQSYLNSINGFSQVQALLQSLESSKTALESNQLGFEVGVRTTVDVLMAQQNVFNAQRDLARATYDFLLSTLNLRYAVGTLNPKDLEAINQMLSEAAPAKVSQAALRAPDSPSQP